MSLAGTQEERKNEVSTKRESGPPADPVHIPIPKGYMNDDRSLRRPNIRRVVRKRNKVKPSPQNTIKDSSLKVNRLDVILRHRNMAKKINNGRMLELPKFVKRKFEVRRFPLKWRLRKPKKEIMKPRLTPSIKQLSANGENEIETSTIRVNVPVIEKGYTNGDGTLSVPIWENGRRVGIRRMDKTPKLALQRKEEPGIKPDKTSTLQNKVESSTQRVDIPMVEKGYNNGDGTLSFPIWENGRRVGIESANKRSKPMPSKTETQPLVDKPESTTISVDVPMVEKGYDNGDGTLSFPIWENGRWVGITRGDKKQKPASSTEKLPVVVDKPESSTISVNVPMVEKGYTNEDGTLSFPIWENGRRVGIKTGDKKPEPAPKATSEIPVTADKTESSTTSMQIPMKEEWV